MDFKELFSSPLFWTQFGVQLGLFLLSFIVLKTLVFEPFLKLIHLREEKSHGLKEEAEKNREKAQKLKVDYEAFMKAQHKKTTEWLDAERKKVTEQEHAIVLAARNEVGQQLQGVRKQINEDLAKVRTELSPLIADFASRIATKLVGKAINISGDAGFAKKNLNNRPVVQG